MLHGFLWAISSEVVLVSQPPALSFSICPNPRCAEHLPKIPTDRRLKSRCFVALLDLSQAAQQRRNRQPLREHGEGNDAKGNHYDEIAPRKILRQR
jgi:hypothetical protein